MDKEVKIEDVKQWVKTFCDDRDWDEPHTSKDLAIGLVTEACELLEIFRFVPKSDEAKTISEKNVAIADELADTLFFLLRFAERNGFDLSQSLSRKLEKNVLRYPPKNRS